MFFCLVDEFDFCSIVINCEECVYCCSSFEECVEIYLYDLFNGFGDLFWKEEEKI